MQDIVQKIVRIVASSDVDRGPLDDAVCILQSLGDPNKKVFGSPIYTQIADALMFQSAMQDLGDTLSTDDAVAIFLRWNEIYCQEVSCACRRADVVLAFLVVFVS